jgi:Flp pilus assembly protein TadG
VRLVQYRGQTTVEFTLVILAFVTILFGAIEVARAISMKDNLTRAAETIAHELAYTDPNLDSTFSMDIDDPTSQSVMSQAIIDANKNANLSLGPLEYDSSSVITQTPAELAAGNGGYYNSDPNLNDCSFPPSAPIPNPVPSAWQACQSVTSADGNIVIAGFPNLNAVVPPQEIRVTVCQPFSSVIGHFAFKSRTDGKACETVTATSLSTQVPSQSSN